MSAEALVPAKPRGPALRADPPPSPIAKAAMILTAVGPELASGFLRALGETDMRRFAQAVAALGRVRQEVLDAVIVEFLDALTRGPELSGGAEAARKLLGPVMNTDQMARLFEGEDTRSTWNRLDETPVPALAAFLRAEHPQTAAVILGEMRAETAAAVLERLDRGFAQDVVLRLSRPTGLDPALSAAIQAVIERDVLAVLRADLARRRPAELIAGLMDNLSAEARDGFLDYLETREPALARDVRRMMFTFEDIATRLNARDMAGAFRDLPEESLLRALRHGQIQGSATPAFVLENLPRRLAERYVEELAALTDMPPEAGEAAQIELTRAIQGQVRLGLVRLIENDAHSP